MGASKLRLVRQLLTERVLLAILAGLAGIVPALFAIHLLAKITFIELPNSGLIGVNSSVLLFTLFLALLTGVLFGVVPGWQAWKINPTEPLEERSQSLQTQRRSGNVLVIGEVALTLVFLTGAGLMLKSFMRLRSTYPGYDSQHVLTMRIALSGKQYDAPGRASVFYREVTQRVSSLPGVESSGAIDCLPTSNDVQGGYLHFTDRPEPKPSDLPPVVIGSITPDYLRAMRIPLLRGRFFSDADGATDPLVMIVDEALARTYWPGQDPIGRTVKLRLKWPPRKIVGVVGNIERGVPLHVKGRLGQVYIPLAQSPHLDPSWGMSIVVSTRMNPLSLASAVRGVIASLAPDQPVFQVETMEEARAHGRASEHFAAWLLGFFSVLALLLAAIGVYGVLSYSVGQRIREIGVRMALGAGEYEVLSMVLANRLSLSFAGVGLGLAGSFALTRLMGTLFHGIGATDPLTFFDAALILLAVGALASYVPARRASRVHPAVALRHA